MKRLRDRGISDTWNSKFRQNDKVAMMTDFKNNLNGIAVGSKPKTIIAPVSLGEQEEP